MPELKYSFISHDMACTLYGQGLAQGLYNDFSKPSLRNVLEGKDPATQWTVISTVDSGSHPPVANMADKALETVERIRKIASSPPSTENDPSTANVSSSNPTGSTPAGSGAHHTGQTSRPAKSFREIMARYPQWPKQI